ncbi:NAD(P)-dependent oxidoreductase [Francisella sp. Scap27]|uniref:NAD(P)-dependent oxidoreductase n=1 Tax=Francisella sp. Scap27 TaxID=2589986 RepID=UPI0015BBA7B5|nr:NAD(P)-dependent oxidoreductase [Francisella sp. Scap27]QLE79380.1 NAD(P)-dependent oxidoreductase [Francisella sp. Scap27]
MTKKNVGIIGLGNMGYGMCCSLLRHKFTVIGTDLDVSKKAAAKEIGVVIADDVKELCSKADIIILSLPMSKHVQQVIEGPAGIIKNAKPNTLIIDTSTSEPEITRQLASKLSSFGHQLLDCPVSGGPAGSKSGTMLMLVGGEESAFKRAETYLDALTSKIIYLGKSGNGNIAKLINNLLCAAHLVTTSEAVALGEKAGLDAEKLIEGLNAGSGSSAISQVNYPRWILNNAFDSGFTMQLMRKDVNLAKNLIGEMDMKLPVSEQISEIWAQSKDNIPNEYDFNCIVNNNK